MCYQPLDTSSNADRSSELVFRLGSLELFFPDRSEVQNKTEHQQITTENLNQTHKDEIMSIFTAI